MFWTKYPVVFEISGVEGVQVTFQQFFGRFSVDNKNLHIGLVFR